MYKTITACRICGSRDLIEYLNLGNLPLANSIIRPEMKGKTETFYPLKTMFCNNCYLSQINVVVDPKTLFWGYVYRSSISKTFQNHCFEIGVDLKERLGEKEGLLALDIASNDGCLLREFKKLGFKVVGCEPATNLAEHARREKIPTLDEFWSMNVAEQIINEYGKVDAVTATNVLGHVDDVHGFISAVHRVLNDEGIVAVEVPTVANIIDKNQFDTIYHEHLSYFLFKPLIQLFEKNDFKVIDVKQLAIHGGTIRVYAAKKDSSHSINTENIQTFLEKEKDLDLYNIETYHKLRDNVEKIKHELISLMKEIRERGERVAAYGAAAKGSTLLNYCGVGTNYIDFVIDDTPEKQYCWTPGNHLPVFPTKVLEEKKPKYLILLPWNFSKELIAKTSAHQERGGKYIIPIPKIRVVSSAEELE